MERIRGAEEIGPRIVRKSSNRGERQPDIDQLEELIRIVGEADAREPPRRAKPTSARRIRSRQ
jgi:hypothetical protein